MKIILSKFIFRLIGWKIIGKNSLPDKCLLIGAPHTSNWDFLIRRCYGYILGIDAKYLIKSQLFFPVFGFLLRINGGIPVYRHSRNNFVDQIVDLYNKNDKFIFSVFVLQEAFMKYSRNHEIHITKVSQDSRFMKQHSHNPRRIR